MATGPRETPTITDALEICADLGDDLRNLQQTLGLEHSDANAGHSSATGELQVMQARVDELSAVLTTLAEGDER
ncbi:MAG: hypothetical protein M3N47_09445 [Chloroflexota bacterium]|nr:hypothetical protein [Chloroflexota bacterium]